VSKNGPGAPLRPSGFDDHGSVNAADYNLWRGSFGSVNDLRADGNGHGIVDAADFVSWRKSFRAGSAAAAIPSGSQVAVPEPHALILSIWFLATPVGKRLQCRLFPAMHETMHPTAQMN
jgi:hypothetical protein